MSHLPSLSELREKLYSAVVADALDSLGLRSQAVDVPLRPLTGTGVLLGRCRTTLWEDIDFEDPEPYALELKAVDGCRPDDVLICAAAGSARSGIWGELLSTAARQAGCVGAVVDGSVRDVAKMRAVGFPVFARGACVYDSLNRQRVIALDTPVNVGGVTISSGDLVIADEDGVVVVPQRVETETLGAAWEKVHAENVTRDAIRAGMKAAAAYEKYGVL